MAYNTAAMCKSFGVSPETALELMWEHWSPRCSPPWDASELEHLEQKVTNGYTYNTSPPGNMTAGYKVAKAQEMFKPVSRDTKGGGKETLIGRFRFIDRAGMGEIKPPEWLITDCLPQGSYSLLIGPRGTFKTFVALDMALSVATGAREYYEDGAWEWTGPWPSIGKTGKVLFAAGEGRGNIVNRVKAWEKYHLDGDEVENFTLVDPVPHPTTEDVTPFIEGALERSKDGYDLVVMDTVGRSMQGLNENSQQDVSMFTQMVQEVQANLKCAVLAIHHTGHENAMRGRGSSVFGADVDAEFVLDREEGEYLVALTNTKQKDAPEWEQPHVIKLRELNVGKKTKSLVACNPNNAEKTKATAHKNKGSKRGRKSKLEKVENMKIVKKAAIDLMREYPNKEFTNNALAEGIMADSKISLSKTTCVTYVGEFLIDSTHPITKCYDRGRRIWTYVK
jgi:RecA-family ATPase